MENERIDVRAVMHECAIALANEDACGHAAELTDALAAVAELIATGKHVDAILWLWRETGTPPHLGQLAQAADAHRAALARVQGGA